MLRFACFIRPPLRKWTRRYEYVLRDDARRRRWTREFDVDDGELQDPIIDVRAWKDRGLLRSLWADVERESPETHTEAAALGWFPEPAEHDFRWVENDVTPAPEVNLRCSRCMVSSAFYPTEAEARSALAAAGWELRDDRLTWCLKCSRESREVPFPTTPRGVARKRRW